LLTLSIYSGVTAGSLAQALSQAAGIAHARKLKGHTGRVFVYMSDGEFQEGQTWEAIMAAVFHGIGNLVAVVDVNGQQCDGKMSDVTGIENLACKISAFGAIVKEVDGHSVKEIEAAIKIPSNGRDASKPTVVLCYTDPCHGLPLLKKLSPDLHYVRFKDDNEKRVWAEVLVQMTNGTQDDRHCQGYPEIIIEDEKKAEECTEEEPVPTKRRLHTMEHSGPSKKKATVVIKEPAVTACSGRFTEMVTRPHRSHLVQWVRFHPKAIVLTADLTKSCEADLLRDELPDQYMSLGMAEQNMMSFAGGLAREGYHPYIHTFAVFVTRRPFDQVAMSIAVPNLPVRLMGFLPGLTTPGGVTHQAIDDVALMRAIPNMRILEVGDATEVESVLDVAESIDGPVYVRMWRGQVPRLFPKMSPMIYGVPRILSDGSEVALVTSGICTEEALKVTTRMGVSIRHIHLSTLVPFPADVIVEAARKTKYGMIVMENHSIIGGVGSAAAEVLAGHGVGRKLVRLGVPGVYAHGASCGYLMQEYGFDASALVRAVEALVGRSVSLSFAYLQVKDSLKNVMSPNERPEDL
jgi:transketolase